ARGVVRWLLILVLIGCSLNTPVDPCRRLLSAYKLHLAQTTPYDDAELKMEIGEGKVVAKLELISNSPPERLMLAGEGRCLLGDLRMWLVGPQNQQAALAAMMEPDIVREPFGYLEIR